VAGIEVLGTFPPDVQGYVVMVAGVGQQASEPAAARAFIAFATSAAALPVIKAKGMERD
jgi:molybdate transport system substrate-binding protein